MTWSFHENPRHIFYRAFLPKFLDLRVRDLSEVDEEGQNDEEEIEAPRHFNIKDCSFNSNTKSSRGPISPCHGET